MADLTLLMERASAGDREATRAFFSELFQARLYIPDRHQPGTPMKEVPYPSNFNYLLGVEAEERFIVPAFTSEQFLIEWGGHLIFREMTGERLLQTIPDGWYCVLNPGQEVEKEFTPWEIEQLRLGPEAIQEILDELAMDESLVIRRTVPLRAGEAGGLRASLEEYGQRTPAVRHLYLLKEESEDEREKISIKYIVGVAIHSAESAKLDEYVEEIRALSRIAQMGDTEVAVYGGLEGTHTLLLSMFKGVDPLYSSSQESLEGLKSAIEAGYDALRRFFTRR